MKAYSLFPLEVYPIRPLAFQTLVIAAIGLSVFASTAHATTIVAAWNFNNLSTAPNTSTQIQSDYGTGTLYADGSYGSSAWNTSSSPPQWSTVAGTTVNALNGDAAGNALRTYHTAYREVTFKLDVTGLEDIWVDFAYQNAGVNGGFDTIRFESSYNAVNWGTWFSMSAMNQSEYGTWFDNRGNDQTPYVLPQPTNTLYVKMTEVPGFNSMNSNSYSAFDNIVFHSTTAVPEPSTFGLALGGLALGVLNRRRLKRS